MQELKSKIESLWSVCPWNLKDEDAFLWTKLTISITGLNNPIECLPIDVAILTLSPIQFYIEQLHSEYPCEFINKYVPWKERKKSEEMFLFSLTVKRNIKKNESFKLCVHKHYELYSYSIHQVKTNKSKIVQAR